MGDSPAVRRIRATPGSGDRGAHESRLGHGQVPTRTTWSPQTGWLFEVSGELVAYARYTQGSRAGMIDAVVFPGKSGHLGVLLDGVIAAARRGRPRPVYCALRTYLMDSKDELTERGFSAIGEQELLFVTRPPLREPRRANPCTSLSSSVRGCPAVCRRFWKVSRRTERYDG